MLNVLKRRRFKHVQVSGQRVSFGTISKGDLVKLRGGFSELSRHIPRFIAEREKGLQVLRTVDEYRRIQHSLAVFDSQWSQDALSVTADTNDIEIEFAHEMASGFALALVELILVCRAVSTGEKLVIANIATSLLTKYRGSVAS
jgi:hypothetical protein